MTERVSKRYHAKHGVRSILTFALLLFLSGCSNVGNANTEELVPLYEIPGADPLRGLALIQEYGCGSCHTIPGVPGANSKLAPPLTAYAERGWVGGVVPNIPENLITWVQTPQLIDPASAMPPIVTNEEDARDVAAYLYSLR